MVVELIKDPTIKLPEIVVPVLDKTSPHKVEKILGILAPLISVNGVIVDFTNVESLYIDSTGSIPTIKFEINDFNGSIKKFESVGKDNYIQIQIIPPFDGAYKKVNLKFYIKDLQVGSSVTGSGSLDIPVFFQSQYKHLGEISTYELCEMISTDCGLGFGTNIAGSDDKRYINCAYKSYNDILAHEIGRSEASQTRVLSWWVDLWNNLILCDLYDRKKSIDNDLKIWISEKRDLSTEEPAPIEVETVFNNSPATQSTELNVIEASPVNKTYKNLRNAQILTVYDMGKSGYIDNQVTDEGVSETIHYEYRGEQYGSYNYMLAEEVREHYIRNITSETVEILTRYPLLGINRGDQIKLVWYDNSSATSMKIEDLKLLDIDIKKLQLGWLEEYMVDEEGMNLNIQLSGQYMVLGYSIGYTGEWEYRLILTRVSPKIELIKPEAPESRMDVTRFDIDETKP